ncbi:MAG: transposase [Thermomicrobiales bacterium]
MTRPTSLPERKSPRLREFDYRSNFGVFVIVCLHARTPLFGTIRSDATLEQTKIGDMIATTWMAVGDQFASVLLDDFIVMPDHLHALITIDSGSNEGVPPSLGEIIGWFKGRSTYQYSVVVKTRGWPAYSDSFWQRSFHDHIIRHDHDLDARRLYIERNP